MAGTPRLKADKEVKGGAVCNFGACPTQELYNKWVQEVHQNWGQRSRRILLVHLADQTIDDSSQGRRRHSDIVAVDTEYCKLSIGGEIPSHSLVVLQGAALVKLLLGANMESSAAGMSQIECLTLYVSETEFPLRAVRIPRRGEALTDCRSVHRIHSSSKLFEHTDLSLALI